MLGFSVLAKSCASTNERVSIALKEVCVVDYVLLLLFSLVGWCLHVAPDVEVGWV